MNGLPDLRNTQVSEAGVVALQQSLPKYCRIFHQEQAKR